MGRVGSDISAMGGDPEEVGAIATPQAPITPPESVNKPRRIRGPYAPPEGRGVNPDEPAMIDREDRATERTAPEPAPREASPDRQPRKPAPEFNLAAIEAEHRRLADEAAQNWAKQRFFETFSRMNSLPDASKVTDDQIASMSLSEQEKFRAQVAERKALETYVNTSLRSEVESKKNELMNTQSQVSSQWRQVVAQYGDRAAAILEVAKGLPVEMQLRPDTYEELYIRQLGQEAREKEQKAAFRQANMSVGSAGRLAGAAGQPERSLTSQEVDRLRMMGLKGKALEAAITRLEGRGEGNR